MIPLLSNNKTLECDELAITTSEVESRTFPIAHKGSIIFSIKNKEQIRICQAASVHGKSAFRHFLNE